MNKSFASAKNTACAVIGDNKENLVFMAKAELGKTVLMQAKARIKGVLPGIVRGYVDSKYSGIVIANVFAFVQKFYLADNAKAELLTDCVMKAAALDLGASFDIPTKVNEYVNGIFSGINLESLGMASSK